MNSRNDCSTPPDGIQLAKEAGLCYVRDDSAGFHRLRVGKGFRYVTDSGLALKDMQHLARIRALVIPPAWTDVWICPKAHGHLQATGRDIRGRKQHRYHAQWRSVRDENKYSRLAAFGRALPRIRARVGRDLKRPGLPREKVLAVVVRLLETTLIRVGNEEYARQNGSFGLTTLRCKHAKIGREKLRFEFRGKSGKQHSITIYDRRLARIVRQCQDLPGQELFQYVDDEGVRRAVDSRDVNEYLRSIAGQEFSAKDYRTWAGTMLAAGALSEMEPFKSQTQAKRNVVAAIEHVAQRLGNTRAVCRSSYIHPAVFDAYLDGTLRNALNARAAGRQNGIPRGLKLEEAALLQFLRRRVK